MNEIAKKRIHEKLLKTMDEESLKSGQVAKFLDLIPGYISMIKKEAQWEHCPRSAWEKVLAWVNSGESMKVYSEKQIKILKEASLKKEEKIEETVKENTKIIEFTKTEASTLISLLKTERLSLEKQIDAIDTLLESSQLNDQ